MGRVIEVPSTGSPATGTDMSDFEDAWDECVCHLFPVGGSRSECGRIPRAEQPVHPYPPGRAWEILAAVCHCGKERCPECLLLARQEYGR